MSMSSFMFRTFTSYATTFVDWRGFGEGGGGVRSMANFIKRGNRSLEKGAHMKIKMLILNSLVHNVEFYQQPIPCTVQWKKHIQAISPYDPKDNSTAVFIAETSEIYTGTVSDFAGNDPLIYRKRLSDDDGLRTQRDDLKVLDCMYLFFKVFQCWSK